LFLGNKKKWSI